MQRQASLLVAPLQNCAHFQLLITQLVKKLAQQHFLPVTSLMQLAQAQVKELLVL